MSLDNRGGQHKHRIGRTGSLVAAYVVNQHHGYCLCPRSYCTSAKNNPNTDPNHYSACALYAYQCCTDCKYADDAADAADGVFL